MAFSDGSLLASSDHRVQVGGRGFTTDFGVWGCGFLGAGGHTIARCELWGVIEARKALGPPLLVVLGNQQVQQGAQDLQTAALEIESPLADLWLELKK
eukprot:3634648-Alexandrium_andersonii.AAC.1